MPGMDEVLAARRAARASRSQGRVNVVAVFILLVSFLVGIFITAGTQNPGWLVIWGLGGIFFLQSPKIAKQWGRAVVLRLGGKNRGGGPRRFSVIPLFATTPTFLVTPPDFYHSSAG